MIKNKLKETILHYINKIKFIFQAPKKYKSLKLYSDTLVKMNENLKQEVGEVYKVIEDLKQELDEKSKSIQDLEIGHKKELNGTSKVIKELQTKIKFQKEQITKFQPKSNVTLQDYAKYIGRSYPYTRNEMKVRVGDYVEITALFAFSSSGKSLFRFLDIGDTPITDHIWINNEYINDNFREGDRVVIKGIIQKYVKYTKKGNLVENYGVHTPEISLYKKIR